MHIRNRQGSGHEFNSTAEDERNGAERMRLTKIAREKAQKEEGKLSGKVGSVKRRRGKGALKVRCLGLCAANCCQKRLDLGVAYAPPQTVICGLATTQVPYSFSASPKWAFSTVNYGRL